MMTSDASLTRDRAALAILAVRNARRSLTSYKHLIWKRYSHAQHLDALDHLLMQCTLYVESGGQQGISHAVIMMPPRHGKTQTISKLYPTWHLGRNPDHRVILASYGATLAQKNSRYTRNVLQAALYQTVFSGLVPNPDSLRYWDYDRKVTLDPRSAAAEAWDLAPPYEGGLDAMGVGGGVTGKGGHIILVDDPVKSRDEAESDVYRDKVWDWFTDDLYTRREPHAAVIVVMTRWHQDDLVGRLLTQQPGKWTVLKLPAVAKAGDALGRPTGAALWPDRYDAEALADIRDTLGSYSWSALYDQEPVPAEGGIFKRANFNRISVMPDCAQVVRFWDLAMSEKTTADFSVGLKMGTGLDGRTKVLDVARRQLDWDDVPGFMADVALADGPEVVIGFEEKGYMSRAGQALAADPRLHNFSIFGYPKDKDKVTNALPFAARVGLQMVDVVEGHWTDTFIDELCGFPKWTHDDQVDAAAGAYEMLGSDVLSGGLNLATSYEIGSGDY